MINMQEEVPTQQPNRINYNILFFISIGILLIIGLVIGIYYLIDSNKVNCEDGFCEDEERVNLKIIPPENGIYMGSWDWGNGQKEFEQAIGKKAAFMCPKNIKDKVSTTCVEGGTEGTKPKICIELHKACYSAGYAPIYGIEYTSTEGPMLPQSIIDRSVDSEIKEVAREIKKFKKPIFWVFQREPMNQPAWGFDGGGYGKNGLNKRGEILDETCLGKDIEDCPELYNQYDSSFGTNCDTLGEVMCLDGPERYRDAARHIHDLVESECSDCVTWVAGAGNDFSENGYKKYYPGNEYIDWHAFDIYFGYHPYTKYASLSFLKAWSEAIELADKPILILELGVWPETIVEEEMGDLKSKPIDRKKWFEDFFEDIKTNPGMKNLKGFIYWQRDFLDVDLSIIEGDPAASAWKREIDENPGFWLSNIQTE